MDEVCGESHSLFVSVCYSRAFQVVDVICIQMYNFLCSILHDIASDINSELVLHKMHQASIYAL